MKKLFLTAFVAMIGLTAWAQDDDGDYLPDGIFALEWKFNPFDYEGKPSRMAEFSGRLFLDAKDVIRFGIGVGYKKDKDEKSNNQDTRSENPNNYTIVNSNTSITNKEVSLKLTLGYEFHPISTGHLDYYMGVEAGYLGRFFSATDERLTNTTNVVTASGTSVVTRTAESNSKEYSKSNADRTTFNENGILASVFTGIDFYVYKKLYIGAEIALTLNTGKKTNGTYVENTAKKTAVGNNITEDWTKSYSSETGTTVYVDNLNKNNNKTYVSPVNENTGKYTKLYVEPSIRIGWMF